MKHLAEIVQSLALPPFCPTRTDELAHCLRQQYLAKGSEKAWDLLIACRTCRLVSTDQKTNPQDHPIGYGDLFQCENGEVIKA